MKKFASLLLLLIIMTACLTNCEDNNESGIEEPFCEYCNQNELELTGAIVNEFLMELNPELDDDAKIDRLCAWLESKKCVSSVKIVCVSCIKTFPEQSELLITFKTKEGTKQLVMDITMSDPFVFSRYHENDK